MHWLYEVQGGKGKNSGQEGQTRNRPIIDWTHGAGLVSFSFFYCTIYNSAPFLTSVICHSLKKKNCYIFTGERGEFITCIGIRPESILPNIWQ